jgi:hypothetical protein
MSPRDSALLSRDEDTMVLVSPRLTPRASSLEQRHLAQHASQANMDRVYSLHI